MTAPSRWSACRSWEEQPLPTSWPTGGGEVADRGQVATCSRSSIGFRPRSIPAPTWREPSREIIARLSYPQAVAWIVARLAEALDHAYGRGVLHGDVKPSNILLTAAGEPMLLDFNLAVGWRLPTGRRLARRCGRDPGLHGPRAASVHRPTGASGIPEGRGSSPRRPVCAGDGAARGPGGSYARSSPWIAAQTPGNGRSTGPVARSRGRATLIRSCRVSITPGLRSILTRCLAPDPADRYNSCLRAGRGPGPLGPRPSAGLRPGADTGRGACSAGPGAGVWRSSPECSRVVVAVVSALAGLEGVPVLAPGECPVQAGPPLGQ